MNYPLVINKELRRIHAEQMQTWYRDFIDFFHFAVFLF